MSLDLARRHRAASASKPSGSLRIFKLLKAPLAVFDQTARKIPSRIDRQLSPCKLLLPCPPSLLFLCYCCHNWCLPKGKHRIPDEWFK